VRRRSLVVRVAQRTRRPSRGYDHSPHVRTQVAPDWPKSAHSEHDVDLVVIVTVAADGTVLDAHVDDSAGADYDDAAIAAVKHWQFDAATRNGRAVPARVRALVHFELPAHESTPAPNPPAETVGTAPAGASPSAVTPADAPSHPANPDVVVPDSASTEAAEDPHGPTEIMSQAVRTRRHAAPPTSR